jgi:hypothetical protein
MKKKVFFSLAIIAVFAINSAIAQVTVGDIKQPYNFSLLELVTQNSDRGLRLPQLTTTERDAMMAGFGAETTNAAKGLMIFNTTIDCVETWNGSQWLSECAPTAPNAPSATSPQNFCGTHYVSDLVAAGSTILWYTSASGGTALGAGNVLSSGTYYASQTVNGVESTTRTAVTVTINPEPVISGAASVVEGSTVNLSLTPSSIAGTWTSANTAVATVSSTGTVTGVSSSVNGGVTTINFLSNAGCAADPFEFTVTEAGKSPITIYCDSIIQFNNGKLISQGVTFADPNRPIIYVKVYNSGSTAVSGVTISASGGGMLFSIESGKTTFTIPTGYSWVKLVGSGTPAAGTRGTTVYLSWTISGTTAPIVFNGGTTGSCAGVEVDEGYGEMSIIFADNNGAGADNWGPGTILASTRSIAIIGAGIYGAAPTNGSVNFKPKTSNAVDVKFKVYGKGSFPWTLSVGNSGQDTDATAAQNMWYAVSGYSTYYAGEIPDIIIHAKENIGPPASQAAARQLLHAYHQHVIQGGWLIYTSRNWNQSGDAHTKYLLDSLGISTSSTTYTKNTSTAGFTINPTAGTLAADLVDGFFGNVNGGTFKVDNNNGSIFVNNLQSWCYPIISNSSGIGAFVAKNPAWKGGFIFLGRNCDAGYISSVSTFTLASRPSNTNAILEMNALAFIVEQNRASDTNMTPPSPLAPTY